MHLTASNLCWLWSSWLLNSPLEPALGNTSRACCLLWGVRGNSVDLCCAAESPLSLSLHWKVLHNVCYVLSCAVLHYTPAANCQNHINSSATPGLVANLCCRMHGGRRKAGLHFQSLWHACESQEGHLSPCKYIQYLDQRPSWGLELWVQLVYVDFYFLNMYSRCGGTHCSCKQIHKKEAMA